MYFYSKCLIKRKVRSKIGAHQIKKSSANKIMKGFSNNTFYICMQIYKLAFSK